MHYVWCKCTAADVEVMHGAFGKYTNRQLEIMNYKKLSYRRETARQLRMSTYRLAN